MSHEDEIPEAVRGYFGHDKVSLFGDGGMPAAPPAPPGSPARAQGEVARADALAKAGTPGERPGSRPTAKAPRPRPGRWFRNHGEQALYEDTMRTLVRRHGGVPPASETGWFWSSVFVPVYKRLPWRLRAPAVKVGSSAKGWKRGEES